MTTGTLRIITVAGIIMAAPSALAGQYAKCPDTLTIGTEGAYPPFNYITDDGDLKGFDVDIAKALCNEMDIKCSFDTQECLSLCVRYSYM